MSCGIYKITNNINNKVYIGQSINIEQRWNSHKYEANNPKQKQYNYSIHQAFRKYGLINFSFDIIELVPENKLNEKEKYWINYYNSYNNGYNETLGGDTKLIGTKNGRAKLKEEDIVYIRTQILNGKMLNEVYQNFSNKISKRGFEHIWRGESWANIMPEAIQYVKSKEYLINAKKYANKIRNLKRKNK